MFKESIEFNLACRVKTFISGIGYYPVHMHPDVMEMICVLKGSVIISDSNLSPSVLSEGDVYIFNANDPHLIRYNNENNIILFLYIDINYYKKHFNHLEKMYFICDSCRKHPQSEDESDPLKFLMAKILYHYETNGANDVRIEESAMLLLTLLVDKYQFYAYQRDEFDNLAIVKRRDPMPNIDQVKRIYDIVDYVYDHYKERLHLDDIAKREYLSSWYLSHFIRQACGLTFQELLSLARCEEAERLLGATDMPIDDICFEVGFSSRKNMLNQFRKWYRTTPSVYRKERRREERENNKDTKYIRYNSAEAYAALKNCLGQESSHYQPVFDAHTLPDHIRLMKASAELYEKLKEQADSLNLEGVSQLFAMDSFIPVGDYQSFIENYQDYLESKKF